MWLATNMLNSYVYTFDSEIACILKLASCGVFFWGGSIYFSFFFLKLNGVYASCKAIINHRIVYWFVRGFLLRQWVHGRCDQLADGTYSSIAPYLPSSLSSWKWFKYNFIVYKVDKNQFLKAMNVMLFH